MTARMQGGIPGATGLRFPSRGLALAPGNLPFLTQQRREKLPGLLGQGEDIG